MVFAIYYTAPGLTGGRVGRVEADNEVQAASLAAAALKARYGGVKTLRVIPAKDSPLPVKDGNGNLCPPSQVF